MRCVSYHRRLLRNEREMSLLVVSLLKLNQFALSRELQWARSIWFLHYFRLQVWTGTKVARVQIDGGTCLLRATLVVLVILLLRKSCKLLSLSHLEHLVLGGTHLLTDNTFLIGQRDT